MLQDRITRIYERLGANRITGAVIALLFGLSLFIRVYFPYSKVFTDLGVRFSGTDAYYHMRLVDNFVHNFPNSMTFDPYTAFPTGIITGNTPFFTWLVGGTAWLLGTGTPSQQLIDTVGAYIPAILGVLVIIPVYFLGKALFSKTAGLISAGLIAILPGEFLGRSILGFTDHHILETLLVTLIMLFLVLAMKSIGKNYITRRTIIYSLLAGCSLGIYMLAWYGAPLVFLIIGIYFAIQSVIDHLRNKNTAHLAVISTVMFVTTSISVLLVPSILSIPLYPIILPAIFLLPVGLAALSWIVRRQKLGTASYLTSLFTLAGFSAIIVQVYNPTILFTLLSRLLKSLGTFTHPPGAIQVILETQPILFPIGTFTFSIIWFNFATSIFLLPIAMVMLGMLVIKDGERDKILLLVWCAIILIATLGQRRFAYYLAINVALLNGYLLWQALKFLKYKCSGLRSYISQPVMGLAIIVMLALCFYPNIGYSINLAKNGGYWVSNSWYTSLNWLKDNTPEPLGNPDLYYKNYNGREQYEYSENAYGVMANWSYGHWITRISKRIPNATPATWGWSLSYLTSQDTEEANEILDKTGTRYIIIDRESVSNKLPAMITHKKRNPDDFYRDYYYVLGSASIPLTLFSPAYYELMSVRLYNFEGQEVKATSPIVIHWSWLYSKDGKGIRVISSDRSFPDYESAMNFINSKKQDSGNWELASADPFVSPIPLAKLENYNLVYKSEDSQVKIFEYISACGRSGFNKISKEEVKK